MTKFKKRKYTKRSEFWYTRKKSNSQINANEEIDDASRTDNHYQIYRKEPVEWNSNNLDEKSIEDQNEIVENKYLLRMYQLDEELLEKENLMNNLLNLYQKVSKEPFVEATEVSHIFDDKFNQLKSNLSNTCTKLEELRCILAKIDETHDIYTNLMTRKHLNKSSHKDNIDNNIYDNDNIDNNIYDNDNIDNNIYDNDNIDNINDNDNVDNNNDNVGNNGNAVSNNNGDDVNNNSDDDNKVNVISDDDNKVNVISDDDNKVNVISDDDKC